MTAPLSIPTHDPDPAGRARQLERARRGYRYRTKSENELWPLSMAKAWPRCKEWYGLSWLVQMGPAWLSATLRCARDLLRFGAQKATFHFDKLRAYQQAFPGPWPPWIPADAGTGADRETDDDPDAYFA